MRCRQTHRRPLTHTTERLHRFHSLSAANFQRKSPVTHRTDDRARIRGRGTPYPDARGVVYYCCGLQYFSGRYSTLGQDQSSPSTHVRSHARERTISPSLRYHLVNQQ